MDDSHSKKVFKLNSKPPHDLIQPTPASLLSTSSSGDLDTFIIDNRTIVKPMNITNFAVEGDSLSRRVRFVAGRYFDNVDFSTKSIRVNYRNAKKETGFTDCELDVVEDDTISFIWVISSGSLNAAGILDFAVEFSDKFGNETYIWQTKPYSIRIENGIYVINDVVPTDYSSEIAFASSNFNRTYDNMRDDGTVINIENRNIKLGSVTDIIVEKDNLSQILSFRIPRYFDNIDLSDKLICIKFINANNQSDRTAAINVNANDGYIEFGWLIDGNVTAKHGNVQFAIEILGLNEKGEFYVWSTKPALLPVAKGIDIDNEFYEISPSWVQYMDLKLASLEKKKLGIDNLREGKGAVIERDGDILTINVSSAGAAFDHAELLNLSYEQSGHTGFVSAEDPRLSDARIASDVYSWAKSPDKLSYTAEEVGAIRDTAYLFNGDYNDLTNKLEYEINENNIKPNGMADTGVSIKVPRADHVHPTDTSRAPIDSPDFTGTPTGITPASIDNSNRLATTEFVVNYLKHASVLTNGELMDGGTWD